MSCDLESLEPFVLGELSATASARVSAHARGCSVCAEEIQWLRREQTAMAARAQSMPRALPSFESVLERTRAPLPAANAAPRRSWGAGLATAAALLVALSSSLHLMPRSTVRHPVADVAAESEVARAEISFSEDTPEQEAIATEEYRYEACLWASPGSPVVDACL